ncbi:MAG: hypothetical protein ACK4Q5_13615 [Saprospiraceae bacterium]
MIQATFTVPLSEFNSDLIDKIKALLNGANGQEAEVFISLRPKKPLFRETRESYFARLEAAKHEIESGKNLVSFSMEEFEEAFADK